MPELDSAQLADAAWAMADAGRLREADALFLKLCELEPENAEAWMMRGAIQADLGDASAARRCLEQALSLDPGYADPHLHLGKLDLAASDIDAAARHASRAVAIDPGYADAWLLLSSIQALRQRYGEAAQSARRVLALEASNLQAGTLLAQALAAQGHTDKAISAWQQVLLRHPDALQAWRSLGELLTTTRRLDEAMEHYRRFLQQQPDVAAGHAGLGMLHQIRTEQLEALACYQRAVSIEPGNMEYRRKLVSILMALGRLDDALAECDVLEQDVVSRDVARILRAGILQRQGDYRASHAVLEPLVVTGAASSEARMIYAEAESRVGQADRAIAMLEDILKETGLSPLTRQECHNRLGRLYDKQADYDQAFSHYHQSNRLTKGTFDHARHERLIERLMNTFTREFFASRRSHGVDAELPVFIVGMPRSGTSLTEQILASHPDLYGAGELQGIFDIVKSLRVADPASVFPESLLYLGAGALRPLAEDYLATLREQAPQALRVTDKMPHNFLYLGLIQLLFPRAKVIHIRRDPMDTCLSCYFQTFTTTHSYAADLAQLGRYYRQYERLMAHWASVLPNPILNVRYEELVEDQERVTRQMVDYCGLVWDNRLLRFHETRRNVATPSFDQVRQPLYKKSVQRWRHYEPHLSALKAALAGRA